MQTVITITITTRTTTLNFLVHRIRSHKNQIVYKMGRSKKNAKAPSHAKRLRNASKETAAKQQYRAIHVDVRERENAARRELHLNPVVHERDNSAHRELHLDPVVQERENAACQELHLHPVVHKRENAARREIHETERLDPVVQERENVARQELHLDPVVHERENAAHRKLHLDPVVHERENAARREIHETERFDPVVRERENGARRELHLDRVVRERENADRRHRQEEENNEFGRGALTDINMSMEEFTYRIRNDKNGECFSLADKNVTNALALFYANFGYHRFGQHLKFSNPPPTLDEVVEQVMPDYNDALLTSKDIKEIELDFHRHHSYYPTNLPACGAFAEDVITCRMIANLNIAQSS
jgi:hypothetical protein